MYNEGLDGKGTCLNQFPEFKTGGTFSQKVNSDRMEFPLQFVSKAIMEGLPNKSILESF